MVRQFPNPDNVALIMKTDKDNPKGISRRDALKTDGIVRGWSSRIEYAHGIDFLR